MYLREIEIENNGPIGYFKLDLPFDGDGKPKPVIFVGQNGAGKSILLSHIVNAMLSAKGAAYDDSEVEAGKVYKLRSPIYITNGKEYYRSRVRFDDDFYQSEIQAKYTKTHFEENLQYSPADKIWSEMNTHDSSVIKTNFYDREAALREKLSTTSWLYFPANRFEEPAWLNLENLKNLATYSTTQRTTRTSARTVINYSPLRENQNWLLDVVYDSFAIERKPQVMNIGGLQVRLLSEATGPATTLRAAIDRFLLALLGGEGPIRWSVGARGRRSISLSSNDKILSPNLFSLSTGQTALLNIFLTIIRDFDSSNAEIKSLEDIKEIVVIDEVDMHLHTELQHTILPDIIELFPRIQFILTSHAPLFILGMNKRLGSDGFSLIELPTGTAVSVERFSEFQAAYEHFKESSRFEADVRSSIVDSQTPILFAEGTIDIDYLERAAELLGRQEAFGNFRVLDANGYGGLDKIWKHFDSNIAQLTNRRVTLLYDCDVKKTDETKPGVKRVVLPQQEHKITKGIENLFPDDLIDRAKTANAAFIDVTPSFLKTVRGETIEETERWEINPDEKRNLADWIIANGTAEEFSRFDLIFDVLED